ncbi:terpenoid synthase [Penicillium desertorum]|uniref:Terpenoid synthase n=1 Tax=Penicillium desertorum TaxID=1303715 RepID=A0A9W9WJL9_9EURO|nr:terpenoid synthase [Penicillium desertorum]
METLTERLLFTARASKDGDEISRIINIQIDYLPQSLLILFVVAILAALFKWPRKDPTSVGEYICHGSSVSKREYEEVVNGFLSDISFQAPDLKLDMGLKTRVENSLESHGISRGLIDQIGMCISTATKITCCAFPFVSHEAKEAIALYASYVITIDDLTSDILPDLENYVTQLILRQSHQHELLRGFTNFLGTQGELFGQFGGDMIVKGSMEFVSAAVIEQRRDKQLRLPPEASDYLVFFRAKTGVAEPFAFFCFPEDTNPEDRDLAGYIAAIPSIMLFLGYVNDLLSFYKEERKAGDCPGFIQAHAKLHGFTSFQSLYQLRNETIKEVQKVRSILSKNALMAEHINQFIHGYIFYHLCSERYKLDDLNIPAAVKARSRFQEMRKVRR